MIHNCSTYEGSSGSPIISRYSDYSIIGLHFGNYKKINLSTNIISIIDDIKKKLKKILILIIFLIIIQLIFKKKI